MGVGFQKLFGQARRFTSEDEVILPLESSLGVQLRAAGLDKPKARLFGQLLRKFRPIRPAVPLNMFPIIHPGALKLGIVQLESERVN